MGVKKKKKKRNSEVAKGRASNMILQKIYLLQMYFSLCLFKGYASVNDGLLDTPTLRGSMPGQEGHWLWQYSRGKPWKRHTGVSQLRHAAHVSSWITRDTLLCKEECSAALKKEQSGAASKTPTVYEFALTRTTQGKNTWWQLVH